MSVSWLVGRLEIGNNSIVIYRMSIRGFEPILGQCSASFFFPPIGKGRGRKIIMGEDTNRNPCIVSSRYANCKPTVLPETIYN